MLVERDHIGVFGKMNSGKSSLMNLLLQNQTSIVDEKAGTTTDTKIALQEIHGLGPIKLYDTAGINEKGILGKKKKKKALSDLKECDLVLVVIDPSTKDFNPEKELIEFARELNKQILVIYNLFKGEDKKNIEKIEKEIPLLKFYKKISLKAIEKKERGKLLNFILKNFESRHHKIVLLPFIEKNEYYILNIPMDEETPAKRFLRPQAMCEEFITRKWSYPVSFRMNLKKARSEKFREREEEKKRFLDFLNNFNKKPKAVITDSQAMDILFLWLPKEIKLTTFSIAMINYFSKGRLKEFVKGIKELEKLKKGDKVLIVEACNHSRIADDIGTVQIPNHFKKKFFGVILEHNFGREFQENKKLNEYKLILHCGGCMLTSQQLLARIRDLNSIGVPFSNYGLFLSAVQGKNALKKVLEPWKLHHLI